MPRRNKTQSNKPFSFYISCLSKKRYKSEKEALNVAEIQMLQNIGLELSVYKCDTCKYWHLTRQKNINID